MMIDEALKKKILDSILKHVDDEPFVWDQHSETWFSRYEIWERAYLLATELERSSVSHVALVMENGMALFTAYFAAMLSNFMILPIDPKKSGQEISWILSPYQNLLVLRDSSPQFQSMEAGKEVSKEQIRSRISEINLDRLYMITFTSGSTGFPKGVCHSLGNLFQSALSFAEAVGLDHQYTMCHVMPMTYMAGILNTILMPFLMGCKIALLPRFDVMSAVRFWKNVEKGRINAFWLSPTMLNLIMTVDKKGRGKQALCEGQNLFFIGTAPLYENIRQKFEETYGVELLQSYGLSETLFLSTELPGREKDPASVGYVLPEVKFLFEEDEEILVNVPWMFLGYSNDDTASYFQEDSYRTGDLGKISDGMLYLTGRKKDLIIKGGMNVSPRQIEDCLLKQSELAECAVAGVHVGDEERIACWYILAKGQEADEAAYNKRIEAELGKHCRVDYFIQVAEIPKNLNGKADKKKMVSEFKQ